MKKFFLPLAVFLLCTAFSLLCLAGCGASHEEGETAPQSETQSVKETQSEAQTEEIEKVINPAISEEGTVFFNVEQMCECTIRPIRSLTREEKTALIALLHGEKWTVLEASSSMNFTHCFDGNEPLWYDQIMGIFYDTEQQLRLILPSDDKKTVDAMLPKESDSPFLDYSRFRIECECSYNPYHLLTDDEETYLLDLFRGGEWVRDGDESPFFTHVLDGNLDLWYDQYSGIFYQESKKISLTLSAQQKDTVNKMLEHMVDPHPAPDEYDPIYNPDPDEYEVIP